MAPSGAHASSYTPSQSDTKIIDHYKIGAEIGKGSFANVYKGVDLNNNHPIAVKSVVRSLLKNKKLLENLEIEITILKDLKHPHIVELLDYKQSETHFHLIMEYCSLGDLSYFLRKKNELMEKHPLVKSMFKKYPSPFPVGNGYHGLNKILVLNYLQQLSSALHFLRSRNLVHRDLKPQNLLLSPPVFSEERFEELGLVGLADLPILKIADFGFARFLPNTGLAETLCGSPLYMAPEILNYQKYTAKADLWSVGAVLYEISVGKPPFRANNHLELFNKIKKAKDKIHFPSSVTEYIDADIKKLICSLLKFEPTERMGFNEFFQNDVVNIDLKFLVSHEDNINLKVNLEPSQCNENLFISEYINKNEIINNRITYFNDDEEDGSRDSNSNSGRRTSQPTVGRTTSRTQLPPPSPQPIVKQISQRDIQPIHQIKYNTQQDQFQSQNQGQQSEIVEKEYVVVEKTAVEINALADELANAGTGAGAIALPNNHLHNQYRRSSRTSSGGSVSGRRPSFGNRRVSISISPTNALSKALGLASTRLFGSAGTMGENPHGNNNTSQALVSIATPIITNNIILNHGNSKSNDGIITQLEGLATKAHVINLFAEVKFGQLIPSPPSSYAIEDEDEDSSHGDVDGDIPPESVKLLADEAASLYVKTLSLLAKAMNIASDWWHDNDGSKPSPRLNEIVQWIRERFNEVLEKAEFVKLKLQEAEKVLLAKNPSFYSIHGHKKIYAEMLIYDRALEIAKNTAKTEMTGQELLGCEFAYSTSIWMLEALLDDYGKTSDSKLEDGDREMVEKYIESITNRSNALKKKIEAQHQTI